MRADRIPLLKMPPLDQNKSIIFIDLIAGIEQSRAFRGIGLLPLGIGFAGEVSFSDPRSPRTRSSACSGGDVP